MRALPQNVRLARRLPRGTTGHVFWVRLMHRGSSGPGAADGYRARVGCTGNGRERTNVASKTRRPFCDMNGTLRFSNGFMAEPQINRMR